MILSIPSATPTGAPPALGTTPTPGTTPELPSIDDMIPQLLPGTPPPEPETAPEPTVEQPEFPVSPFVEGSAQEPEVGETEIPHSPFESAQTQTLEEEMGGEAAVAELPQDLDISLPEAEVAPPGLEPTAEPVEPVEPVPETKPEETKKPEEEEKET